MKHDHVRESLPNGSPRWVRKRCGAGHWALIDMYEVQAGRVPRCPKGHAISI